MCSVTESSAMLIESIECCTQGYSPLQIEYSSDYSVRMRMSGSKWAVIMLYIIIEK
jgi:hypothetical protein